MSSNYDFRTDEVFEAIDKALETYGDKCPRFNVLISGKVGVGKSTLVNSIFHENLAPVGIGHPVLIGEKGYTFYEKEGVPVRVYDTEGIELNSDQQDKLITKLMGLIRNEESINVSDRIHMIWYCINATSLRFESEEVRFINRLSNSCSPQIPVIIVLTKSFLDEDTVENLKYQIEEEFKDNSRIKCVVPVLAEPMKLKGLSIEAFGLELLCKKTAEHITEAVKGSFIMSQKVSLNLKIERAKTIVNHYAMVTAGIGAGAGLVGFDDALVLMGVQAAMFSEIGQIFGLKIKKDQLISLCSATVGTVTASLVGKTIFSRVSRMIPGVGQYIAILDATARASIAGVVTKSIGTAFVEVMKKLATGEISEGMIEKEIIDLIKKAHPPLKPLEDQ